jgi:hypothetical protein
MSIAMGEILYGKAFNGCLERKKLGGTVEDAWLDN